MEKSERKSEVKLEMKIDTVHVLQNTDLSPVYMGMPGSQIGWFGSLFGIWIACAVRKIL